ncbi:Hypothetical predicted protein [Mytilus galloprovincialis]|uniref:Uncharacterized protein n=1 Tax=Mytilus galloprovincialis TaxID=29158 RepID=A0A8B6GUX3_MYTGA|nr:Hypothetical predicted protein [Mytilus galloprovincialis]
MAFKRKTQDENVHSSEDSPNGKVKQVKPHCDTTFEKSIQNQNIELSKDINNQDLCCSISKAAPVIEGSGNSLPNHEKPLNTNLDTWKLDERVRVTIMLFVIYYYFYAVFYN